MASGGGVTTHFAGWLGSAGLVVQTTVPVMMPSVKVARASPTQIRRHAIFRWYLDHWYGLRPRRWTQFRDAVRSSLEQAVPGLTMPTTKTTLAKNLEFVLRRATDKVREVIDVALLISVADTTSVSRVEPAHFRLVNVSAEPIGGAGYVTIRR